MNYVEEGCRTIDVSQTPVDLLKNDFVLCTQGLFAYFRARTVHKSRHIVSVTLSLTPCTDSVRCHGHGGMAPRVSSAERSGGPGSSTGCVRCLADGLGADCGRVGQGELKQGPTLSPTRYPQGRVRSSLRVPATATAT